MRDCWNWWGINFLLCKLSMNGDIRKLNDTLILLFWQKSIILGIYRQSVILHTIPLSYFFSYPPLPGLLPVFGLLERYIWRRHLTLPSYIWFHRINNNSILLETLNHKHVICFSKNSAPCTKHQSLTNSFKNGGSAS